MKPMRLMDRPEDYSRLNVQPQKVAPWEDGRRDTSRPGAFEWWYFDAILDDGTKVVSVFMPKHRENLAHDGNSPTFTCSSRSPMGRSTSKRSSTAPTRPHFARRRAT